MLWTVTNSIVKASEPNRPNRTGLNDPDSWFRRPTCVLTNQPAHRRRRRATVPPGWSSPTPYRGGACCVTASCCSTTTECCSLTVVPSSLQREYQRLQAAGGARSDDYGRASVVPVDDPRQARATEGSGEPWLEAHPGPTSRTSTRCWRNCEYRWPAAVRRVLARPVTEAEEVFPGRFAWGYGVARSIRMIS